MTREEIIALRKRVVARVDRMRQEGDWGAGAADIRENAETQLAMIDHLLERMRG